MKKENIINKKNIPFGKGWGIAGFILGLLSIFLGVIGLIPAILGLIFCIIQFKKGKTGLAIAGLILSIIGIVNGIAAIFVWSFIKYLMGSAT